MKSISPRKVRRSCYATTLVALIGVFVAMTLARFLGAFDATVSIELISQRAGLVMEPGAKVRLRGVQVGEVKTVRSNYDSVRLELAIDREQLQHIPANIGAEVRATTVFGAKYVDLIYPRQPSRQRLGAGAKLVSKNVSTEVNTVFQNLVALLNQIDPAKLNGILSAFAVGLGGQGSRLGEAITDSNQVLSELNPRADTIRKDWRSVKGFSDTYNAAAQDLVKTLAAFSTASMTITDNKHSLDALLLSTIGLSRSGINLLGPNKDNLVKGFNALEPTTALLSKYNPEITCTLVGAQVTLDKYHWRDINAGNGFAGLLSGTFQWGGDPYRYPDNLPLTAAKGGPGGKPGCGSLPDVAQNWPVRALVTNTGWGTGIDYRPNPGIGFPGWQNFFPVTRAVPEPPSIRYTGGPAPGPAPTTPGGAPYGAPWYAPDGTPLFPGLPPSVPSDASPRVAQDRQSLSPADPPLPPNPQSSPPPDTTNGQQQ